jgi:hypothetical protein
MEISSQPCSSKSADQQPYVEFDIQIPSSSCNAIPIFSRDQKCEICINKIHKYKCPRCDMKTCSLECCRKHKENMNCSGIRHKAKFIKREEFNEASLLSDYKYLEENNLLIDSLQRNNVNQEENARQTFGSYENLRKFLHKSFNINLRLMPIESTRHKNNKTRFNKTTNLVSWSLEFLLYVNKNEKSKLKEYFKFNSRAFLFSSKENLTNILRKFLRKFKYELLNQENFKEVGVLYNLESIEEADDSEQNKILSDMNALYEIVDFRNGRKYFIKLDLNKTLEESLKNKTIIEYPSIYLVKNSDLEKFAIEEENVFEHTLEFKVEVAAKEKEVEDGEKPQKSAIKQEPSDKSESEEGECDDNDDQEQNKIQANPLPKELSKRKVLDDESEEEGEIDSEDELSSPHSEVEKQQIQKKIKT